MPENQKVYGRYKGQGLVFIGIHIDPSVPKRDAAVKEHKVKYPICEDMGQQSMKTYHVSLLPTIVVIGKNGKVLSVDPPDLDKAVQAALKAR